MAVLSGSENVKVIIVDLNNWPTNDESSPGCEVAETLDCESSVRGGVVVVGTQLEHVHVLPDICEVTEMAR